MPTPNPVPYPSPSNGVMAKWHCENATPVQTTIPNAGGLGSTTTTYIPYYDCAVSQWQNTYESQTSVSVTQAPNTVGTPNPAGYNTATQYGGWDDHFVTNLVQGVFIIALGVLIIGLLVHWGKVALFGNDAHE